MCFRISINTTRTVLSHRPYDPPNPRTRRPERHCADLACVEGNDERPTHFVCVRHQVVRAGGTCVCSLCECVDVSTLRVCVCHSVRTHTHTRPRWQDTCCASPLLALLCLVRSVHSGGGLVWPCLFTGLTIDVLREKTPPCSPAYFQSHPQWRGELKTKFLWSPFFILIYPNRLCSSPGLCNMCS